MSCWYPQPAAQNQPSPPTDSHSAHDSDTPAGNTNTYLRLNEIGAISVTFHFQ